MRLILFILLIPSLFLNIFLYNRVTKLTPGIPVLEVLDGDTILLEGKVRLRLRSVDAPELKYCGGRQALFLLSKLLKGKKVVLEEQVIDKWGRPMALVYTGGKLINLEILKSGWGRYHHDGVTKEIDLKKAAEEARGKKAGIYGLLCTQTENPDNPNCTAGFTRASTCPF